MLNHRGYICSWCRLLDQRVMWMVDGILCCNDCKKKIMKSMADEFSPGNSKRPELGRAYIGYDDVTFPFNFATSDGYN